MLGKLMGGTKHERDVKAFQPLIDEIHQRAAELEDLADEALRGKTAHLRQRLAEGETVDDLLAEAFAVVVEACRRHCGRSWDICGQSQTWQMVPFDVQLMGAVALHQGKIAEMATGEGKTLVAVMPLYLNALVGRGVHLVTVNDYLAQRDSEWMGRILEFLGLTVGCIQHDMTPPERRAAYGCDVTYGTNNEFGFDYLRDNMAVRMEDRVQRGHHYSIVDEVDSVLIDEARTPLIISGPVQQSNEQFTDLKPAVERVVRAQTRRVNDMLAEVEKLRQNPDAAGSKDEAELNWEIGSALLTVQRGAPKNRKLLKLYADDPGLKKMTQAVEANLIRDKALHQLDEKLYYVIDEKNHVTDLSDEGRQLASPGDKEFFVLPDLAVDLEQIRTDEEKTPEERIAARDQLYKSYAERSDRIHAVHQLLRAYALYEKDVEYVIQDGKVLIVDEFTGRIMPGRRFSDGLHQALEAKEGVQVGEEMQTLATITLQNYFRLYDKLAGMTGTAETEASEFFEIYKLDVVVIPTNREIRRIDHDDVIFRTRREKYNAILDELEAMHKAKLPVLVGTVSVDVSETLSRMLKRRGLRHEVLNAKNHHGEAGIVAKAGEPGAITIATNMAGRGTDIKLGEGVIRDPNFDPKSLPKRFFDEFNPDELPGGLHIIGTERHESRRIDRQLRGRAGRQGDPGSSRFFLSLEDDLMRLFAPERMAGLMEKLGVPEGEVIEHPWVTKSIERAQRRVEAHNFDIRKRLLEYDNVMNQQREVIYDLRLHALEGDDLRDEVIEMVDEAIDQAIHSHIDDSRVVEEWDLETLRRELEVLLMAPIPELDLEGREPAEQLREQARAAGHQAYTDKEAAFGPELMRQVERYIFLRVLDEGWRDHLHEVDQLREGIGWQSVAGKDPLIEYKKEAFGLFEGLLGRLRIDTATHLFRTNLVEEPDRAPAERVTTQHAAASAFTAGTAGVTGVQGAGPRQSGGQPATARQRPLKREEAKVGRNAPCPCGSGKKYKHCHLKQTA